MAEKIVIRAASIERAVLRIRGRNVMLDDDLAALYEVQVRALNQAVSAIASDFLRTSCSG